MTKVVAALVLLGLGAFTCQELVFPEDLSPVIDLVPDIDFKNVGSDDALLVGHILRSVARDLYYEAESDNETDEYFVKELWRKIMEAVKRAVMKIMNSVGEAMNEAAATIKEATDEAMQGAKEQALEILERIVGDNVARYAADEFDNRADFVRGLCARIDKVGKTVIETGRTTDSQ